MKLEEIDLYGIHIEDEQEADIEDIRLICKNKEGPMDAAAQRLEDTKLQIFVTMGMLGKMQKNRFDEELEQVGLTAAQVQVLLYLLHNSGKGREITAREIERRFHVSNPTVSGILKRLERKGFIVRVPGSIDKRNKQIRIRGDVETFCRCIEERVQQEKEKVFYGFTPEELERLLQLITKLLHNLKKDRNEE